MKDGRPLMERALEYVGLLDVGSEIVDDTDTGVIADFRHLLPGLLYRRGLFLEQTGRGQIVTDRPPWRGLPNVQPITCATCRGSWFDCEHGSGMAVAVAPALEWPLLPLQRTTVRALG